MRLPASVRFPFGYRVNVKLVTDTEMADACEDGPDGLWDAETRTIRIRKALPLRRQKYILGHEIGHAWLDWVHECIDEQAMKP